MKNNIKEQKKYIFLSFLFALSIGQFAFFGENHVNLLRSLANNDYLKLNQDWLANQIDHTPLFTFISSNVIKYTSLIGLNILHIILSLICSLSIFYICKINFSNYNFKKIIFFWFLILLLLFKEKSFAYGVAGQYILNPAYQPSTFGVLLIASLASFAYRKETLSIILVILSASIHPTYIIQAFFLICGYLIYLLIYKNYKTFFKVSLLSLILITPIILYLYAKLYINDLQINLEAQLIMAEKRIPHHAMVISWFSYKDLQILLVIFFSLLLTYKEKRLFIPLLFVVLITVILTAIQYFTSSNFLGLLFPWRSSVYIVPICSMIVLTKFLIFVDNRYLKSHSKLNLYSTVISFFLIIFLSISGILESYKSNKDYKTKYPLSNLIKEYERNIVRILIPAKLKQIRLNTGLPIFVDWKLTPFKNDAIIEWYERIKLTNSFYSSTDLENQKKIFVEINNKEQISHILIKDNDKNLVLKDCKILFKESGYLFYDIRKCNNIK
tara:strand:+ start:2133 stop:3626 length:1494 start_codon:yes stop_codon:yes gene_type:complete